MNYGAVTSPGALDIQLETVEAVEMRASAAPFAVTRPQVPESTVLTAEKSTVSRAVKHRSENATAHGLVRNALTGYLSTGVSMLVQLVQLPVLLHYLGDYRFGIWTLSGSAIAFTGLIELGMGTALAKRVAEHEATDDRERLAEVLGTAFLMYIVVAILVMAATGVLALFVGRIFHLSGNDLLAARLCVIGLGANQAIVFLFTAQNAFLYGAGRLDLTTTAALVINIAGAVLTIGLVVRGVGIITLPLVTVAATIAGGIVARRIISTRFPHVRISVRAASRPTAVGLLRFGLKNAAVYASSAVSFGSDTLVIGYLLPVSAVAQYAIAAKLTTMVRMLAVKPIDVTMPAYAHAEAVKDRQRQFRLITESVVISLSVALPMMIAMCVFGDRLVRLWVGPGHGQSVAVLACLSLVLLFQLPGHVSLTIMTGTEKNGFLAVVMGVSAVVNLILSVIFTLWLRGPVGVVIGSLITVAVANAFILPLRTCRQFGFSFRAYLRDGFGPLILPTLGTTGLAVAVRMMALPESRPWTIAILGLVAGSFGLLWLAFQPQRRNVYLSKFAKMLRPAMA